MKKYSLRSPNTYRYIYEILNVIPKIPSAETFIHVKSLVQPPQSAVSSQSQSEKQPPPPPRPPNKSSNKRSHRRPKGKYAFGSSSSAAACSVGPRNKEDVDILGSGFRIALPVLYFPKGQLSMDYSEWRLKQAQFERTFAGSGGDSQSEERRGDSKHDDAYLNGFSVHTPPSFCPTESLAKAALGFSSSPEAQLQSSSGGESFRTCASEVVSTNGVDGGENSSELQPSQEESVGEPEETIQTSLDAFQGHCQTTAGPKGRTRGVTDTESRLSRKGAQIAITQTTFLFANFQTHNEKFKKFLFSSFSFSLCTIPRVFMG